MNTNTNNFYDESTRLIPINLYEVGFQNGQKTIGRIENLKPINQRQLINTALEGTSYDKSQVAAAIELVFDELMHELAEGASVSLSIGTLKLTVSGVFKNQSDKWDNERHKLNVSYTPSARLRSALANAGVVVNEFKTVGPYITSVTKEAGEAFDNKVAPGTSLLINGSKIRIAGDSPSNGVEFRNIDTNEVTRVATVTYNKPSQLFFSVPALSAGKYTLNVTTQYSGSKVLITEPRTATYDQVIEVE